MSKHPDWDLATRRERARKAAEKRRRDKYLDARTDRWLARHDKGNR